MNTTQIKSISQLGLTRGFALLAVLCCAAGITVAFATANAGDPDSTSASWKYVSGNSGPVAVTVTGAWSWGDNSQKNGGKDSQSCWPSKPTPGYNNVDGHWAVGIAVSWNDASTPNVLTGKALDGSTVTLHVGNSMDWTNPNYCAGTTAAAPYPSGTFTATHQYPSLNAFLAATNNGQVCVNAYDVHKPNDAKESDPSQNGDNTLKNGHYALTVECGTAVNANAPTPPAAPTPAGQTPPPPPPPPAAGTPAAPAPIPGANLAILKLEKTTGGTFVSGPLEVRVGGRVFYEIVVTNTGSVPLTVTLDDPGCRIRGGAKLHMTGIQMAVGQKLTYHCAHVAAAADAPSYTNTATANGISASANAAPVASTVVANVTRTSVLAAHKVITHKKAVTHKAKQAPRKQVVKVAKVTRHAKAAPKVVKAASFTG